MRADGQDPSRPAGSQPAAAVSSSESAKVTEGDYLRIYPKLAAKIRQFGIRPDEVEEVVQQTFLEAQKGLGANQFKGESTLDTWVISIGKNLCLKHFRAQNTEKRKAPEVPIDFQISDPSATELALKSETPLPDRQAEDRDLLARVLRHLRAMPAILREPLVLKVRGYSYKQIARLLGIEPNLVSSRIYQARSELLRDLTDIKTPPAR